MKKFFVVLCAIFLIVLSVLPCCALAWDNNAEYQRAVVNPVASANWRENTGDVMLAVDRATDLGLFGGIYPTAILYRVWEDGFYICAVVPSGDRADFGNTSAKDTAFFTSIVSGNKLQVSNMADYSLQAYSVYYLAYGGDWFVGDFFPTATYLELSTLSSTSGYVAVAFRDLNGSWAQPNNMTYGTGWQSPKPSGDQYNLNGVRTIADNYAEYLEPTDTHYYTIDIPAIFDSMFNGAGSILGAFDITFFGINIVNILIAVVVIAIVAFIVRKLVK